MGSNIGDSIETLHDAAISLYGLIDIIEVSPVGRDRPGRRSGAAGLPQRRGDGHDPPGAVVAAGRPARHRARARPHPRGALGPADARPRPDPVRRPGLRHRRRDGQPHPHPAPPAGARARLRAGAVAAGRLRGRAAGRRPGAPGGRPGQRRWTCPASGRDPTSTCWRGRGERRAAGCAGRSSPAIALVVGAAVVARLAALPQRRAPARARLVGLRGACSSRWRSWSSGRVCRCGGSCGARPARRSARSAPPARWCWRRPRP